MKERQSNLELLRIIAMLMVVLYHANYHSLGYPVRDDILAAPWTIFWRALAEQVCVAGVNIFILISGWFGINPSVKKFCSLLFQVLFYGIVAIAIGLLAGWEIPIRSCLKVFYFGGRYWFVIAYFVLFILSPVLNSFVDNSPPRRILAVIACFFAAEFIYDWLASMGTWYRGFSAISFVGLYLLARFLRLYSKKLKYAGVSFHLIVYFLMTLIPTVISYLGIRNGWNQLNPRAYTSPFIIAAAVSLLLCFSQLEFSSKFVNWIAGAAFSVYLLHVNPVIFPHFKEAARSLAQNLNPLNYSLAASGFAAALFLLCAVLDKVRLGCWKATCSLFLDKAVEKFEAACDRLMSRMGY
jgi:surface polysaccharide O-acyltransferase-like enzyme